ncbi:FecR domain-containing protein [Candidatus Pelagibacter sp.]|nr:FecR domain-containing protein [Candidatus Pelagibacter sp.]
MIFITFSLKADENNIGMVSEIKGEAIAINNDLEERDLNVFDPIFSNEEIFTTENSSLTLQFNDDTTILMKELTSLVVSDFKNSKLDPKFKSKVSKGKIVVETGSIAKNKTGEMEVIVNTSSLGLRGTRVNAALSREGKLEVSLGEDNFGNVGLIELVSNNQSQSIFSTDQVIEILDDQINEREKSNKEQNDEKLSNRTFVNNSKINEEEIEIQLISKLLSGKIDDANNDGKIDIGDVKSLKNLILKKKQQKVEFIIDNSKNENTEFLSSVIDSSDKKNTGETLEKIMETKDSLVENVVEDLSDKNNEFLITSNKEGANLIKEKIFETIVAKETNKSAAILSKVMAKSDVDTISSVINNITDKNENEESKLSLKVMADFTEKNPQKLEILFQNNEDEIKKLTVSAVKEAAPSKEDADLIAKVVAGASDKIANNVVSEVTKNSTDEKQALSVNVMKSIIDNNPEKIDLLNDENKETIINQTINAAKNQADEKFNNNNDLSSLVANIILNSSSETALSVLENLNKTNKEDSESKIGLSIFVKLSEEKSFESKLEDISNGSTISGDIVEELVEIVIKSVDNDKELVSVKNIVKDSGKFLTKTILDIDKNSNNQNKLKIDKIIDMIIKEDPIKAKKIIKEKKEIIKKPKKIEEINDVIDDNISPN